MRSSRWIWGAAVVAGLWWWTSDDSAPARRPTLRAASDGAPALAVLGDKFALSYPVDGQHVVSRLGLDGAVQHSLKVGGVGDHVQLLGVAGYASLLWVDDQDRPRTTMFSETGRRHDDPPWDYEVARVCDGGAASTDVRSVGGWIDGHGGWGVLFAPSSPRVAFEPAAPGKWCRVGVQKDHVVVLFRAAHALQLWRFKPSNEPRLARTIKHDIASRDILGFACIEAGCVAASRNPAGALEASFIDLRGKVTWTKVVDAAPDGGRVAITSTGSDRLAIGYGQRAGDKVRVVVATLSKSGDVKPVWRGEDEPGSFDVAPALAWTRGKLAIARRHHGERAEVAVDVRELE